MTVQFWSATWARGSSRFIARALFWPTAPGVNAVVTEALAQMPLWVQSASLQSGSATPPSTEVGTQAVPSFWQAEGRHTPPSQTLPLRPAQQPALEAQAAPLGSQAVPHSPPSTSSGVWTPPTNVSSGQPGRMSQVLPQPSGSHFALQASGMTGGRVATIIGGVVWSLSENTEPSVL